jgi:uncharacterized protein (DUF983 family)
MATQVSAKSPAFPIGGLLGVAFIVLKLTHIIEWSWLWVLAPFWIPLALLLTVALVGALIVGVIALIDKR